MCVCNHAWLWSDTPDLGKESIKHYKCMLDVDSKLSMNNRVHAGSSSLIIMPASARNKSSRPICCEVAALVLPSSPAPGRAASTGSCLNNSAREMKSSVACLLKTLLMRDPFECAADVTIRAAADLGPPPGQYSKIKKAWPSASSFSCSCLVAK